MSASRVTVYRALALESLGDATRRRIVPVIVVVSVLSLLAVDSCTSCAPTVVANGELVELGGVVGWSGLVIFTVLGLWTMVLAGVLAADHLAETLADGSAALCLARPVGRGAFALARLTGVLVLTFATGAVLLGATALLLHARHDVALGAAAWAAAACAAGAVSVGALAMTASLFLPPIGTTLVVLVTVAAVALTNVVAQFGTQLGTVLDAIDRLGPPLGTAMLVALSPWVEPVEMRGEPLELAVRLTLWAVGSAALLVTVFRRRELGR